MFRFLLWAILAALKPKALVVAENLCLRQQLLVLQRRQPRPYLKTADRLFWVLASRWLSGWRNLLLIVKPQTVGAKVAQIGGFARAIRQCPNDIVLRRIMFSECTTE